MGKLHPMLRPYGQGDLEPFGPVQAGHLYNRAAFGGTPDEISTAVGLGLTQAVEALLGFPAQGAGEQAGNDVPDLSGIEGYPRDIRDIRRLFAGKSPEQRMELRQMMQRAQREAVQQVAAWWMRRMANGPYPLQEKLTLFWHGHFTTSARDERSAWLMWQQNETLRRNSAGNFHEFVLQISRDPAMLDYLNNQQNRKKQPNENFARELLELFTLGIGHYSERDIKEAARAFTGWHHDGDEFVYNKNQHDEDPKVFMGASGNLNGDDIITIICRQKACASFICGKLWRYFVGEPADPGIIDSLAEVMRDAKYEMKPVLRTVFSSRGFYDGRVIGAQIKSPIQLMAGTARLLGAELPERARLRAPLEQMGQIPLMPPNVKGWPGGRSWINTTTLFARYNAAVTLVRRTNFGKKNTGPTEAIADGWVERMIGRPIPSASREALVSALRDGDIKGMVELIVSMPEYQLC